MILHKLFAITDSILVLFWGYFFITSFYYRRFFLWGIDNRFWKTSYIIVIVINLFAAIANIVCIKKYKK